MPVYADGQIEELLGKQEITEQIYRYCRAMDRIDNDLGVTVWHPDGLADYGPMFQGSGAEFIDWVSAGHRMILGHSHQISNVLIDIHGDRASSEAYVTAVLRMQDGDIVVERTVRGRYFDRWSHCDGRWAIDKRHYIHDLDDIREVSGGDAPTGYRDKRDPTYGVEP